jgi:putative aldouronate transport system substrate-binding protein
MKKSTPQPGKAGGFEVGRRGFLGMIATGAAVVGVPSLLSACGTSTDGGAAAPSDQATVASSVLPNYYPVQYVKPDYPSVKGSTPGYKAMPSSFVQSVKTPPGSGKTYTVMTPLWGTIPPSKGNSYYEAVNTMLGANLNFQISDGNTYGDKISTVLASAKDVPDWVCVPGWNFPSRFGDEALPSLFQDLTPYLSGDKIKDYPNLANIPTAAWKFCVFDNKLYGLPMPGELVDDATFYRNDLLAKQGITPHLKSADDLLDLAKELTGGKQWGAEDLWTSAQIMFGVPPEWKMEDGKLVNAVETDEYRQALEWNTKLFKSGSVNPDAVASNTDGAKTRFQSGKSLICSDGLGGWHEALATMLGNDPSYSQLPFDPIAGNGGTPVLFQGSPASIFSFLKKSDDDTKIKELLGIANAIAAPFGTTEFNLINNGVKGKHYTLDSNGQPVPTKLAAKELQPTYIYLVDPPISETYVQYPGYDKAYCDWMANAAKYVQQPMFFAQQIVEPAKYASLSQPFTDLASDVPRGRKSMKDLDAAIKTWQTSGGNDLRDFYQKILDAQK